MLAVALRIAEKKISSVSHKVPD